MIRVASQGFGIELASSPAASTASLSMSTQRPQKSAISGCILCGGASRRMGTDKAELQLGSLSLLEQAIRELEPLCGEVLLASGEALRETKDKHQCVLDEVPGAGPLAGITAALAAATGDLLCVLACDMPGATAEHYERLLSEMEAQNLDACWFTTAGRDEPLFAVYRTSCLSAMRASLAQGRYKVLEFHQQPGPNGRMLRTGTLELSQRESTCSRNLNTPEDFAREQASGAQPRMES